jgi:hypothetical protein
MNLLLISAALLCSSLTYLTNAVVAKPPSPLHHPFFLRSSYQVKGDEQNEFFVRQVPGDGGCLFHSIATWLTYATFDKHLDFDWRMRYLSIKLRELSVEVLRRNQSLHLENNYFINSVDLLDMVGERYNMSSYEYCAQMLDEKTWGGGPEIVALSNHFQCPIHIYNLSVARPFLKKTFKLQLLAKFGSPIFDTKAPIQLLCADGRFPNLRPGTHKDVGDHFLALFPCDFSSAQRCSLYDCPGFEQEMGFFDRKHDLLSCTIAATSALPQQLPEGRDR